MLLLAVLAVISVLLLGSLLLRDGRLVAAARRVRQSTQQPIAEPQSGVLVLPKYVPPADPAEGGSETDPEPENGEAEEALVGAAPGTDPS
jgi:hypothetical protein